MGESSNFRGMKFEIRVTLKVKFVDNPLIYSLFSPDMTKDVFFVEETQLLRVEA